MPIYTSPDVRNLSVGTEFIEFRPEGADDYFHVGNVPKFEFKMRMETLDHFTPVNGMKVKSYTWTVELAAEIEMEMEEITAANLAMLMLGEITAGPGGQPQVSIAAQAPKTGALRYTGTNETGPRWMIDLHSVSFNEDGEFSPLASGGKDFNSISVKGSALAVDGVFGLMTLL